MNDVSKLINAETNINFFIKGEEKSFTCKEMTIREKETYNNKLISEARTLHIRKINEVASGLAGKEKTDFLIGATNAMPNFEDTIGSLIFSNNGIRLLIKSSVKPTLLDKDIDDLLDDEKNGKTISEVLHIALKIKTDNEEQVDPN